MSFSNPALVYKKVPSGSPVAGQDIAVEDTPKPTEAPDNGLLIEVLSSSLDPYLRGLLRDPSVKSYFPAFELNKPFLSGGIAKVLESKSNNFKTGDIVRSRFPIQRYAQVKDDGNLLGSMEKLDVDINDKTLDYRNYLGSLGMPGLTAYSSFYEIGKPKKGETIFISSAAGAVGQVVGQLAKHEGLTVIGSVGSDEKAKHLIDDLKFDGAFNYKKESVFDALPRLAPKGVDIYYENVGSEHLAAAIDNMNKFGRIIACGMISEYSASEEEKYPHKNLMKIVGKQLTIRGFLVNEDPDCGPKHAADHAKNIRKWLKDGTFTAKLHESDISVADKAFVGMLNGENFGKAVINLS